MEKTGKTRFKTSSGTEKKGSEDGAWSGEPSPWYKTLKAHQGEEIPIINNNPTDKEFGIKFGKEFGIKYGIKFGINEKTLLLMLNSNPSSTAADVAEKVGISLRGAEKMIKRLKNAGVISREGSRKNGLWIINKDIWRLWQRSIAKTNWFWQELPESYSEESITQYRDAVYNYVSQHDGGAA